MNTSLKDLIRGFDDEDGVSEAVFEATCGLISSLVGDEAATVFSMYVDATDGRFYLIEGTAEDCLADMEEAAKRQNA